MRLWYKYCGDMVVSGNGMHTPNINYLTFTNNLDNLIEQNNTKVYQKKAIFLSHKSHQLMTSTSLNDDEFNKSSLNQM